VAAAAAVDAFQARFSEPARFAALACAFAEQGNIFISVSQNLAYGIGSTFCIFNSILSHDGHHVIRHARIIIWQQKLS